MIYKKLRKYVALGMIIILSACDSPGSKYCEELWNLAQDGNAEAPIPMNKEFITKCCGSKKRSKICRIKLLEKVIAR